MTMREKLNGMADMADKNDRDWHKPFDRQGIMAWYLGGHMECSPVQASGLMACAPYSLNVQARYLRDRGADRMGGVHFRFSGNRLRLNVIDLMERCGWDRGDLKRLMS